MLLMVFRRRPIERQCNACLTRGAAPVRMKARSVRLRRFEAETIMVRQARLPGTVSIISAAQSGKSHRVGVATGARHAGELRIQAPMRLSADTKREDAARPATHRQRASVRASAASGCQAVRCSAAGTCSLARTHPARCASSCALSLETRRCTRRAQPNRALAVRR